MQNLDKNVRLLDIIIYFQHLFSITNTTFNIWESNAGRKYHDLVKGHTLQSIYGMTVEGGHIILCSWQRERI